MTTMTAGRDGRVSAQSAKLTMAFSNVGHFFTHFLMLIYATVVLALDGTFALSYGELLSLSLLGFILYGAAALPAGWLGDRWSAEAMMVIFFVALIGLSAAAIPLVGMIYDATGGFYALLVVLTLLAAVIVAAAVFLPADARPGALGAAVQSAE
jgi:hypothetical protein